MEAEKHHNALKRLAKLLELNGHFRIISSIKFQQTIKSRGKGMLWNNLITKPY